MEESSENKGKGDHLTEPQIKLLAVIRIRYRISSRKMKKGAGSGTAGSRGRKLAEGKKHL